MSLTQWNRGALEKLIVPQLVKKFLPFYGTPKYIAVVKEAHHGILSSAS
jgi:hypothetical protein